MNKKHRVKYIIIAVLVSVLILFILSRSPGLANKRKAVSLIDNGNQYLSELKFEEAAACFVESLQIEPQNGETLNLLADTYVSMSQAVITVPFSDNMSAGEKQTYENQLTKANEIIETGIRAISQIEGVGDNESYEKVMEQLESCRAENSRLIAQVQESKKDGEESTLLNSGLDEAIRLYQELADIQEKEGYAQPFVTQQAFADLYSPFCDELMKHIIKDPETGKYTINNNLDSFQKFEMLNTASSYSCQMGNLEYARVFYEAAWNLGANGKGVDGEKTENGYVIENRVYDIYGRMLSHDAPDGYYTFEYGNDFFPIKFTRASYTTGNDDEHIYTRGADGRVIQEVENYYFESGHTGAVIRTYDYSGDKLIMHSESIQPSGAREDWGEDIYHISVNGVLTLIDSSD